MGAICLNMKSMLVILYDIFCIYSCLLNYKAITYTSFVSLENIKAKQNNGVIKFENIILYS